MRFLQRAGATNPPSSETHHNREIRDTILFNTDPKTGRSTGYNFTVNGKTDSALLTWNPNGTLARMAINNQIPGTSDGQTCNYAYDDLARGKLLQIKFSHYRRSPIHTLFTFS